MGCYCAFLDVVPLRASASASASASSAAAGGWIPSAHSAPGVGT